MQPRHNLLTLHSSLFTFSSIVSFVLLVLVFVLDVYAAGRIVCLDICFSESEQ